MLCLTPHYSPTVLYARQRVRGERIEQHDPAFGRTGIFLPGIYRFVLVEEGSCRITRAQNLLQEKNQRPFKETVIREGHIGLLQPHQYTDISMARHSRAQMVGFIVTNKAQTKRDRRMIVTPAQHEEPSAEEVWGCDLAASIAHNSTYSLVDDIRQIAAIWWQDDWHHYQANHLLGQILFRLADAQRKHVQPSQTTAENTGPNWTKRVQQLINDRLPMLQSTADLAAALNRNPQAMARTFKKHIGVTPATYLRNRRLERTVELVRSTRLPIKDIAAQVGYRNVAALDHAWKKTYNLPPLVWRDQQ